MQPIPNLLHELEARYCPPLDIALFRSIVSDFDIANSDELASATQVLDSLKEDAEAEDATGFDPSGSSGGGFAVHDEQSIAHTESTREGSNSTDTTSLGHGLAQMDLRGPDAGSNSGDHTAGSERYSEFDGMDHAAKEAMLVQTFPDAKLYDIQWTLKKCNGDASLAIDELLNQTLLEETGTRQRGIEGFSESDACSIQSRKRKGKKKHKAIAAFSASEAGDAVADTPAAVSQWERAHADIEFISERTSMPINQISSVYHKHSASSQATILALIDAQAAMNLPTSGPRLQRNAVDLARQFPSIPVPRLLALLQLTAPSVTHAEDLARILTTRPKKSNGTTTPIQISFQMPPPDLGDTLSSPLPRMANTSSLYPEEYVQTSSMSSPLSTNDLASARSHAFAQAQVAHRKGKSDALMGAAAGYYSQVGRDLSAKVHASQAAEMDQLVAAGATGTSCDLHGVDVKNGVRIAKERVAVWWGSGRSSHGGYRIVVGRGTHSEGGRSRLAPAVLKALVASGYLAEVGQGVIVVRGVASRPLRKM